MRVLYHELDAVLVCRMVPCGVSLRPAWVVRAAQIQAPVNRKCQHHVQKPGTEAEALLSMSCAPDVSPATACTALWLHPGLHWLLNHSCCVWFPPCCVGVVINMVNRHTGHALCVWCFRLRVSRGSVGVVTSTQVRPLWACTRGFAAVVSLACGRMQHAKMQHCAVA